MEAMEAAASGATGEDQPYMVSSLPLVLSEGRPMRIESMSERGLVAFVRFMLKCALGVNEHQLRMVRRPPWWLRTMPYFNFKARREVEKGHSERLRDLVRSCYHGNRCEFLLQFCGDLEEPCATGRMLFKNNFDGTSSLYERATDRLVVTCRNENLEYDGPAVGATSPRRHLLPRPAGGRRTSGPLAMVQPPTIQDIYLCDHCSTEFTSISQVKEHERQCGPGGDAAAEDSDAESVRSEPEAACHDQTRFLSYIGLKPSAGTGIPPYSSPCKQRGGAGGGGRLRRVISAQQGFPAVDISSPLGVKLAANKSALSAVQPSTDVETYCDTRDRKRSGRQPTFVVTWRPLRKRGRIVQRWSHQVCFSRHQRAKRMRTIRTGLTSQARRLLRTAPVPCSVRLTRLTEAEITEACREKTPPPPPAVPEPAADRPLPYMLYPTAASANFPTAQWQSEVAASGGVHLMLRRLGSVNGAGSNWYGMRGRQTGVPYKAGVASAVARRGVGGRWRGAVSSQRVVRPGVFLPRGMVRGQPLPAGLKLNQPRPGVVGPSAAFPGRGVRRSHVNMTQRPAERTPLTRTPVRYPPQSDSLIRPNRNLVPTGLPRRIGATGLTITPVGPASGRQDVAVRRSGGGSRGRPAVHKPLVVPTAPSGEPLTIDLCSSSDEEDNAAAAPPPATATAPSPHFIPVLPKRETTEALEDNESSATRDTSATSATNGTHTHQSKNARSHWPVSWGCSANGGCGDTPSVRMRGSITADEQPASSPVSSLQTSDRVNGEGSVDKCESYAVLRRPVPVADVWSLYGGLCTSRSA